VSLLWKIRWVWSRSSYLHGGSWYSARFHLAFRVFCYQIPPDTPCPISTGRNCWSTSMDFAVRFVCDFDFDYGMLSQLGQQHSLLTFLSRPESYFDCASTRRAWQATFPITKRTNIVWTRRPCFLHYTYLTLFILVESWQGRRAISPGERRGNRWKVLATSLRNRHWNIQCSQFECRQLFSTHISNWDVKHCQMFANFSYSF